MTQSTQNINWEQVAERLAEPLSPDAVKPAPKGKYGEYIEGLHAIREANRIFGFGGWSYEVTRLELVSEKVLTLKGQSGPYEQARVGYLASVRVTVDGRVIREGTAVGSGMGNPNSMADHHESAVKEAETDALKRALRTFGNTFGLALYEKDPNAREVGYSATPQEIEAAVNSLSACIDMSELKAYWTKLYANRRHVADHADVLAAKDYRKDELERKAA